MKHFGGILIIIAYIYEFANLLCFNWVIWLIFLGSCLHLKQCNWDLHSCFLWISRVAVSSFYGSRILCWPTELGQRLWRSILKNSWCLSVTAISRFLRLFCWVAKSFFSRNSHIMISVKMTRFYVNYNWRQSGLCTQHTRTHKMFLIFEFLCWQLLFGPAFICVFLSSMTYWTTYSADAVVCKLENVRNEKTRFINLCNVM